MAQDIDKLKSVALFELQSYLDSQDLKKQSLLSYWIRDYVRFLRKEDTFDPQKLIRYKRGAVVKVHFGFRIGSEEGGLHYAVVLDVNNALSAPTVTVVPLTSVKQHTDLNRLHFSKLFLGDEIYTSLQTEIDDTLLDVKTTLNYLFEKSKNLKNIQLDTAAPDYAKLTEQKLLELDELEGEIHKLNQKCYHLDRMRKEIVNMKRGSIALVGQITTVSKIRIYDPLYPADTLANIRLSPELMTKLDEKVRTLFTHNL